MKTSLEIGKEGTKHIKICTYMYKMPTAKKSIVFYQAIVYKYKRFIRNYFCIKIR